MAMAPALPPSLSAIASGPGADPGAGLAPPPVDDAGGGEAPVLVTITDDGNGGYMVYAGEPPETGEPPDPNEPPPADGKPAASLGEALKAVMDILKAKESSSGAPGSASDQFDAGFNGPAPASGMGG